MRCLLLPTIVGAAAAAAAPSLPLPSRVPVQLSPGPPPNASTWPPVPPGWTGNPKHYGNPKVGCEPGEVASEMSGVPGQFCSPTCSSEKPHCPSDMPAGVTANPSCALQRGSAMYCALMCTPNPNPLNVTHAECGDALCNKVQNVGICTYDGPNPTHYGNPKSWCKPGEINGAFGGVGGEFCSPKCASTQPHCPSDVPAGVTATPACTLQVGKNPYCALMCEPPTNSSSTPPQCGNGKCVEIQKFPLVGICVYPGHVRLAAQAPPLSLALRVPSDGALVV